MSEIIDIKKQNREALNWILNFYDLRRAYIDKTAMFSTLGAAVNDGMPRGTDTGNPAANKAISLVDLEKQKTWIMVIELMERTLSEKSRKYLELRRDGAHQIKERKKRGPIGWVDHVQPRYAEWFNLKYGRDFVPSEDQMKLWMNKIIDVTVRLAINKGVLW